MENYTKYALKSIEELKSVLAAIDDLFIVTCNKCFNEYNTEDAPELEALTALAQSLGKTVTGSTRLDFLCNKLQTGKKLSLPEGTACVFVISCGLGVQTVAELVNVPVFAACDSPNYTGHHGMALTKKACDACAQCYLTMTGGICPIVDCSKSLVNGQCGGAKNGKCEVSPDHDCAWAKIHERLESQGRLGELLTQSVQVRDYSKANFKVISEYVKAIRESRLDGYYGGVHPCENKEYTEHKALEVFPAPETVVIPMSQHLGAPANPIVNVGDKVLMGQKIGEASAFISAPVHASVSGEVIAIEDRPHANRGTCLSVVIRNDGNDTLHPDVKGHGDLNSLTKEDILAIVKDAGIVGMGGAGFPTAAKLNPAKPVDTLLLNGCECEPYLTADHRLLLEYADEVIFGVQAALKATGAEKAIMVIEDNKPDAIALMEEKLVNISNMEVCVARTKYPQGAEKMLIKKALGRQVPNGGLPADVGVVVCNVSTVKAIADAITKGLPLIERVTTVTGEHIAEPKNFIVRIGTPASALVERCGGITGENVTVKAGGPMMGFVQNTLDTPIMKGSNGIIAVDSDKTQELECIKCGRCVDVCPMELKPLRFHKYKEAENWLGMKQENVMDCIECRCCEYICSSKIPLVSKIKAGKAAVREMK